MAEKPARLKGAGPVKLGNRFLKDYSQAFFLPPTEAIREKITPKKAAALLLILAGIIVYSL